MIVRIKTQDGKEFNNDVDLLPNNWWMFCEEIEIQGRLHQTRTGANYHYQLIVPDRGLYGKRTPYVHLLFKNAYIYTGDWHGDLPCNDNCRECKLYCVGLGGTLVNVPFIIKSETPPTDLTNRKERRDLMQKIKSYKYIEKIRELQGDIIIYSVSVYEQLDELQNYLRSPNRPIVIEAKNHKHYIKRLSGKVFRSANDILFVPEKPEDADNYEISFVITTDDDRHWHEGACLTFNEYNRMYYEAILINHP